MNLFILDKDPVTAARYHCDKHVVKMILETTQMLCTAHSVIDETEQPYKVTHLYHPCTKWICESCENYNWTRVLVQALCREYTNRYEKLHSCEGLLYGLFDPPEHLSKWERTPFVQCMPNEYKIPDDPVQAYRNYYIGEKAYFAKWKLGAPEWWRRP